MYIDEEHLVNDAYAVYKNPNFDPTRPLKIIFSSGGQQLPGVDLGGLNEI